MSAQLGMPMMAPMSSGYTNGAPPPPPPPAQAYSMPSNPAARQPDARQLKEKQKREEEKRRQEKEKQKQQQQQKHAQAQAQQQIHLAADPQNRLRRETPFIAHIKFRNDLPEIPSDPKMLVTQIQPERLAHFQLTTLEKEPKRDLLLGPNIHFGPLDVDRYQVPEDVGPLDPADFALLKEDTGAHAASPLVGRRRGFAVAMKSMKQDNCSWLMRTTYISNETTAQRKTGMDEKRSRAVAGREEVQVENDRAAQIAAIEATFEAAKRRPVHIRNPALQAVEILPVFPDFDGWANKYVLAKFDDDPMEDILKEAARAPGGNDTLINLPPDRRATVMAGHSMLKGFTLNPQPDRQERIMALLTPTDVAQQVRPDDADRDIPSEELAGDYQWSKDYGYQITRDILEYFVRFQDKQVTYCDINMRLDLRRREDKAAAAKKRRREGDDEGEGDGQEFQRPSRITITHRGYTEREEEERELRRARLAAQAPED